MVCDYHILNLLYFSMKYRVSVKKHILWGIQVSRGQDHREGLTIKLWDWNRWLWSDHEVFRTCLCYFDASTVCLRVLSGWVGTCVSVSVFNTMVSMDTSTKSCPEWGDLLGGEQCVFMWTFAFACMLEGWGSHSQWCLYLFITYLYFTFPNMKNKFPWFDCFYCIFK